MLNWVFGKKSKKRRKKPGIGNKPPYEKAREIASRGSVSERQKLAAHEDLEPEILYYFATDDAPEVRREVAENRGTPLQADLILSTDPDEEVRCELAMKIGRLVPELDAEESEQLTEMALEVLEILANDELPRVRAIIAEELKSEKNVPKNIVQHLAEELEDIVSVPILEYSPLLSEADLLEIIARGMKGRALVAVARRRNVTEPVVDAVVAKKDTKATKAIIENETSKISDKTFDTISDEADDNKEWHNAMVYRDGLPVRTIMRIATFVSASLMETLIERNTGQKDVVEKLRKTVRGRIEKGQLKEDKDDDIVPALDRANEDFKNGDLDEERVDKALDEGDNAYVRYALINLSELTQETVSKMLNTGSAKAITALVWKAGLSMGMAVQIQQKLGRVSGSKLLKPTADGGFPLSQDDFDWYMESFF
ncbi:MAG: DUF2336 domain-containing protein [Rhodospirillaceae bacterium]|nr:DUF2336 domain-containing protein [Rhodospirillaceae bacterium]MBT5938616.1 DUF2336 domain-containing protein [Rhodospirillaceae bacterium]